MKRFELPGLKTNPLLPSHPASPRPCTQYFSTPPNPTQAAAVHPRGAVLLEQSRASHDERILGKAGLDPSLPSRRIRASFVFHVLYGECRAYKWGSSRHRGAGEGSGAGCSPAREGFRCYVHHVAIGVPSPRPHGFPKPGKAERRKDPVARPPSSPPSRLSGSFRQPVRPVYS